ncbi:HAMP domain-containing histidine kinase [bacterium]|nr:HAMP domain-containing histidine kinase [bacterium]
MTKIKKRFLDASIFFKMLLIVGFSALLINIVISVFYNIVSSVPLENMNRLLGKTVDYWMNVSNQSLDLASAEQIDQHFGVMIRYERKDTGWSTNEAMPFFKDLSNIHIVSDSNYRIGIFNYMYYLIVDRGTGTYIFGLKIFLHNKRIRFWLIVSIMVLSLVMIGAYRVLKKLFSPIQALKIGVDQVGKGNLDHKIPIRNNDELGELSSAFNEMTAKIKHLLYSKEQLMLNVSHELRSPLTRMKIAIELLGDDSKKDGIAEDINQMESMISELLESARLESKNGELDVKETDLVKTVAETCEQYKHISPRIKTSLPANSINCFIDRTRIQSVLRNLLENALKYSNKKDQPVSVVLTKENRTAIITILDEGEGIPAKDLPHVFEPFYRVDKSRSKETGGYGLGLSICRKIVEAHDGRISMRSIHGKETEVTIELPIK